MCSRQARNRPTEGTPIFAGRFTFCIKKLPVTPRHTFADCCPPMDSLRRGSLVVIFLTVFIDLLGFGMVLPLLPIYAKQFTSDKSGLLIGLLMASFSAMQFLFAPMWGRLSDRIGRRPVLMIGLAGSIVFYTMF